MNEAYLRKWKGSGQPRCIIWLWGYLQENQVAKARDFAEQARELYKKIEDPRGVSDVDEQLGDICRYEGNTAGAKHWLLQSIIARRRIGNKQGIASSLRRLALVFFQEHKFITGTWYLGQSLWLYARMKMISRERLLKLFKDQWIWFKSILLKKFLCYRG